LISRVSTFEAIQWKIFKAFENNVQKNSLQFYKKFHGEIATVKKISLNFIQTKLILKQRFKYPSV
jgi:hypothetical protein